jgi:nucleoside-triphosphatase THEP1
VLLELTRNNPAIICIDALDECEITTRKQILDTVGTIISSSEQIVKVFISSRREDDFLDYFIKWSAIEISAKDNRDDIVNFIDAELKNLNRSTTNKSLLNGHASDELVAEIKQVLLDRADGM